MTVLNKLLDKLRIRANVYAYVLFHPLLALRDKQSRRRTIEFEARISRLPKSIRRKHEYCFFLHDQCVAAIVEYEKAKANEVEVTFPSKEVADEFKKIADNEDAISALEKTGFLEEAKRVRINQITMGMVSDCLSHLYEALRCFEKRKTVVAINLLRKPLKDNLFFLSWILGDEVHFLSTFMSGDPSKLSSKATGNFRIEVLEKAANQTQPGDMFRASLLNEILFERNTELGLDKLFQHAVHLITTWHIEFQTSPENFNFIFKFFEGDDDVYEHVYEWLPYVLLFLAHVIIQLFHRMHTMESGALTTFFSRSVSGYSLVSAFGAEGVRDAWQDLVLKNFRCRYCGSAIQVRANNALDLVIHDKLKCLECGIQSDFPVSWLA